MAADSLDHKQAEFLALAGTAFNRMFGSDGQNGLVTFAQREQRACEVTDEMARRPMAEHLAQDPVGEATVERECPICGGPVHYDSAPQAQREVRELMTRRGKIEYRRAALVAKIEYAGGQRSILPAGGRGNAARILPGRASGGGGRWGQLD